jgi:hypothetical protein
LHQGWTIATQAKEIWSGVSQTELPQELLDAGEAAAK